MHLCSLLCTRAGSANFNEGFSAFWIDSCIGIGYLPLLFSNELKSIITSSRLGRAYLHATLTWKEIFHAQLPVYPLCRTFAAQT